ncbi:MAG: hypothetical protein ACP5Q4_05845, partial [Candidatus Caldatribacteriaceae bacterium]
MMFIEEFIRRGNPQPNWQEFWEHIRGARFLQRVPFVELLVDREVVDAFQEQYLGEKPVSFPEDPKKYLQQYVSFFHRLGYDLCVLVDVPGLALPFPGRSRVG